LQSLKFVDQGVPLVVLFRSAVLPWVSSSLIWVFRLAMFFTMVIEVGADHDFAQIIDLQVSDRSPF
jgi:hypothetical protein